MSNGGSKNLFGPWRGVANEFRQPDVASHVRLLSLCFGRVIPPKHCKLILIHSIDKHTKHPNAICF
jgi:hypothetical protein